MVGIHKMEQARPRVNQKLYNKLINLGLTVDDAMQMAINRVSGTSPGSPVYFRNKIVPQHAVIDPSTLADLAQDASIQSLLTELQQKLETTTFNNEDFSTETTLDALNTKIDEDTDDDNVAGSQTLPILLVLPYVWDGSKWIRQTADATTGAQVDLSGLGGTALSAVGSLGALGTGLFAGIGSAAGNLLTINSNGDISVLNVDRNGNSLDPSYDDGQALNVRAVRVYAWQGEVNAGSKIDRIRHSHFKSETKAVTGTGTTNTTQINLSKTPMSKIACHIVNFDVNVTDVTLQGSLDSSNWFTIQSGLTSGSINFFADKPILYLRLSITHTGADSVVYRILTTAR